jgi:diguanylate cyclase (GGDEF)-like protein/hemerythrin-like metal-binding protein/PAS domain S-box-containing protein
MARILIVEDEPIISRDLRVRLSTAGHDVVGTVTTGEEAVDAALESTPDLVIMDISLDGEMDGIEAADLIRARDDTPVLYLTSHTEEDLFERAKRTEPFGYLSKPVASKDLERTVEMALVKHGMEKRLRASEERYRAVVETQPDPICRFTPARTLTFLNSAFSRFPGNESDEPIGADYLRFVSDEDRDRVSQSLAEIDSGNPSVTIEHRLVGGDGRIRWHQCTYQAFFDERGLPEEIQVVARDVTERRKEEDSVKKARDELGRNVLKRTADLSRANQRLLREIEERRQAQEKLRTAKERYALATAAGNTGVWDWNPVSDEIYADPILRRILGYEDHEMPSRSEGWIELVHSEDRPYFRSEMERVLEGASTRFDTEIRMILKDGAVKWFIVRGTVIRDEEGRPVRMIGTQTDVTDRKHAEERLDLAAKIIEGSNEAICVTDTGANIIGVNDAFCKLAGYERHEVLGKNPRVLKSGRHDDRFYEEMWRTILSEGEWRGEIWDRRKNGEIYPKLLSISAVRNHRHEITHYVGFSSDLSKIKQTEERLERLAHFDPLTGLANRFLFRDRMRREIEDARGKGLRVGLMVLDLDRFKDVNDTLGHPAGDALLTAVAERLRECVGESETVSRIGGDEFSIVLPGMGDVGEPPRVGRRILETLARPFDLAGREAHVSCSIGISLYPDDGDNVDKLLQHADTALYRAKERGKNTFMFFSGEMNRELVERAELEADLRTAVADDRLSVFYQPIVDFDSGVIVGAEALLRWIDPTRGSVSRGRMIPLAEDTGLIVPIGEWVLRSACEQGRRWREMGFPPVHVAVNVSGRQLMRKGFVDKVIEILEETGMEPADLELELTETVAIRDVETTIDAFRVLKDHGIGISIDDFGTGYSSLSYLKRLPVDKLKIDRSFITDIASYRDHEPILGAIVAVAHSLGLTVTAEGIETRKQVGVLWSLDCDQWQGYYFSRPVPEDQFTGMLKQGRTAPSLNFQWTPDLAVHVEKLDDQHREWFKRVDALCKSILEGKAADELAHFVGFLEEYSREHFRDEENLMRQCAYPGYETQSIAHSRFVAHVRGVKERVEAKNVTTDLLVDLTAEMHRWFVDHIAGMDRPLGDYLASGS